MRSNLNIDDGARVWVRIFSLENKVWLRMPTSCQRKNEVNFVLPSVQKQTNQLTNQNSESIQSIIPVYKN